ncbi:MAG: hypothetical protein ABIB97_05175 [Patescibacteria group bacterium]
MIAAFIALSGLVAAAIYIVAYYIPKQNGDFEAPPLPPLKTEGVDGADGDELTPEYLENEVEALLTELLGEEAAKGVNLIPPKTPAYREGSIPKKACHYRVGGKWTLLILWMAAGLFPLVGWLTRGGMGAGIGVLISVFGYYVVSNYSYGKNDAQIYRGVEFLGDPAAIVPPGPFFLHPFVEKLAPRVANTRLLSINKILEDVHSRGAIPAHIQLGLMAQIVNSPRAIAAYVWGFQGDDVSAMLQSVRSATTDFVGQIHLIDMSRLQSLLQMFTMWYLRCLRFYERLGIEVIMPEYMGYIPDGDEYQTALSAKQVKTHEGEGVIAMAEKQKAADKFAGEGRESYLTAEAKGEQALAEALVGVYKDPTIAERHVDHRGRNTALLAAQDNERVILMSDNSGGESGGLAAGARKSLMFKIIGDVVKRNLQDAGILPKSDDDDHAAISGAE